MRVDRIIRDVMRTLRQVVQVLDRNVTVQDNFGASGAPEGYTIVSQGREVPPKWAPADELATSTGSQAVGKDGVDGAPGSPGAPGTVGPPGPQGEPGDTLGHWEPAAFDSEIIFDSEGDVLMVWVGP